MKLKQKEWETLIAKTGITEPEKPRDSKITVRAEKKFKNTSGQTTTIVIESEEMNLYAVEKMRDYLESVGLCPPVPIKSKLLRLLGFSPILG